MKKIIFFLLIQIGFSSMRTCAQSNANAAVFLTNYTIEDKSNTVGYVKSKTGQIKSITIGGEHASAFKISNDNKLSVRHNKLKTGATWFDISLTVESSLGKLTENFRIVKDDFIRNKIIAHRGAWKNTQSPQNSIAALSYAVKLGCEGSEFDVHMSADSLPVINHDPSIQGVSIAKTNLSELLKISLANGERLPTLEEYLKGGMVQNRTKLILEIKPSELGKESSIALTNKIIAIVEKLHAQAWVDYISFDYDVCKEVMKLAPYAKVAYLKGDKTPTQLAGDNFFGLDYNFKVLQENSGWVKDAKSKNLTVNVWTVNDKVLAEELLRQGVDFITTDEPELLLSIVK